MQENAKEKAPALHTNTEQTMPAKTEKTMPAKSERELHKQTAVITVVGRDRVGIIAAVSAKLAEVNVNIKDISQTILQDVFTMIMLVDISQMSISLIDLADRLEQVGTQIGLSIKIQHADIFDAMHRI